MYQLPEPGDNGVIARLARRTTVALWLPVSTALLITGTGWWWPGWASTAVGLAVALAAIGLGVVGGAVLWRRAQLWTVAGREASRWRQAWFEDRSAKVPGWIGGRCGDPVPLYAGRGRVPMVRRERRLPSSVLPVRTDEGALAAGEAVVLHARADGALPASEDSVIVLVVGRRGPYLLARPSDGVIFTADRWTFATG